MPDIEVVSRRPQGPVRPAPLLFVHGAFSAAWIWEENFLPWFAADGWECHALSLRGHGASGGRDRLPWHSLADYVADVLHVQDGLRAPPILIGHSMGGMVVQRALLEREAAGAVLMASAPPHGLWESTVGLAWRDPLVFHTLSVITAAGARHANREGVRRAMFSDRMPAAAAARFEPRLQDESRRVLIDMMQWNPFPRLPPRSLPVLVLGAGKDVLFPPEQVRSTARAFGTTAELFDGMGHAMMLEPGWEDVAARIAAWAGPVAAARGT